MVLPFALLSLCLVRTVYCHARLMEPPSRSSMWRLGFANPTNYDDDGLYCGGISTQWKMNGGKCGICGDPWNHPHPRPNEAGGKFGQGILVRHYKTGQVIPVSIDVTANHNGYFEFRVCPTRSPQKEVIQECLDKHTLRILNGTGTSTQYYVGNHGREIINLAVRLPKSLTCKHCVFQWTYVAGNNWGPCKDGRHAQGCGPQETFRACADVSIGNQPASSGTNFHQHSATKRPPPKEKKKFPVYRPKRPPPPKIQSAYQFVLENHLRRKKMSQSGGYWNGLSFLF